MLIFMTCRKPLIWVYASALTLRVLVSCAKRADESKRRYEEDFGALVHPHDVQRVRLERLP